MVWKWKIQNDLGAKSNYKLTNPKDYSNTTMTLLGKVKILYIPVHPHRGFWWMKNEIWPLLEHEDLICDQGTADPAPGPRISLLPKGRAAGWSVCWASFSCSPFRTATASAVTTWTILADTSSAIKSKK